MRLLTALWAFSLLSCTSLAEAAEPRWRDTDGEFLVYKGQVLELHTAPGSGYPLFHAIETGESLRIFKRRGEWYKVETADGTQGWVHRTHLNALFDAQDQLVDFPHPNWKEAQNTIQLGLLLGKTAGAISYTTYLNYRFTEHLSTEVKYTQAFGDFSSTKMASLHLLHHPFPQWRLSPFFSLGSGSVKVSPNAVVAVPEDRQDSFLAVGGGVIYHFSARIDLRAEYSKSTILTTRESNEDIEEWKAGFSLLF
jgi:opacity protein-like surface antigen